MTSGFAQVGAQLAGVAQQQSDLQRAVAAGQLWMEAGVAENAALRCERTINEIEEWLTSADRIIKRRKFGRNKDGRAAADRFGQAGQDVVDVMRGAQRVFAIMAATYWAADGRSPRRTRRGSRHSGAGSNEAQCCGGVVGEWVRFAGVESTGGACCWGR